MVVAALRDAGLQADYGTYSDVALTYNRILEDLLERSTFSVTEAVSVCMQQCNKSTFLKEGRGQSGRKCPEVCEDFGNALVVENNRKIDSLLSEENCYNPYGRIYSANKKFYVDGSGEKTAVYESKTNKKIATVSDGFGEDGTSETNFVPIVFDYEGYCFSMICSGYYHGDGCCSLQVGKNSGLVYTDDKKFYIFNGCTQYVYETGTNNKIAKFESEDYKDVCRIIDSRYDMYVCERKAVPVRSKTGYIEYYNWELKFQTIDEKKKATEEAYYNDWLKLQKCLDKYRNIDFSEINNWLSLGVFNSYGVDEIQRYYKHRDYESKLTKFTSTSYGLYNEMKGVYGNYCPAPSSERLAKIRREVGDLVRYFLDVDKKFSKIQTSTLKDAIWEIEHGLPDDVKIINASCCGILGQIECAGECNKVPGTQDYVTCTLGKLKGTFEFDDICDGNKF